MLLVLLDPDFDLNWTMIASVDIIEHICLENLQPFIDQNIIQPPPYILVPVVSPVGPERVLDLAGMQFPESVNHIALCQQFFKSLPLLQSVTGFSFVGFGVG